MLKLFLRGSLFVLSCSAQNPTDDGNMRGDAQPLDNYSFDFSSDKLPIAYEYHGSSIQLHHKLKLIPDVKDRYGAITLKKQIMSDRKY